MSYLVFLFVFLVSGVFAGTSKQDCDCASAQEAPANLDVESQLTGRALATADDADGFNYTEDEGSGAEGRSTVQLEDGECILKEKQMDVVFLIDLGVQSGPHSVQFFTEYIMSVLRLFDIEDRNTRVALVTYGSNSLDGLVILGLREGNNHRAIQLKLQELIKGFYTFSLSRALRKAGSIFATSPRAAQKLVFVITFTPMVGSAELAEILAAGRALGSGVSIYLVAIDGASSDHLLAQLMLNRNMFRGSYKITQDYDILDIVERTQDALKQQYRCDECTTNQCPRYQSCTSVGGQTVCVCNLGYVDGYCSDTDPCRASPCPPGQICRRNGFSHTCQPDDADTCLGTVCLNQAQCFIEQGMPKCQCTPGYVGDSCQARCPRCSAKHFCLFENQRAVCKCRSGTGPNCDPVTSPCSLVKCINNGQCVVNSVGFAFCRCPLGYQGTVCEISPCRNHPCRNGGTCVVNSSRKPYCVCSLHFEGEHCDKRSDCTGKVCRNGGYCEMLSNVAVCRCMPMYFGRDCGESRCDTRHFRCFNGGVCELTNGHLPTRCRCPPQWKGVTCQLSTCQGYCYNGGTCGIIGGRPSCSCPPDYTGDRCQTETPDVDPCTPFYCQNGGTCISFGSPRVPSCICGPNFTGSRCENTLCTPPCTNGGTCLITSTGNVCECVFGRYGRGCEFTPCDHGYCQNGATCVERHVANILLPECQCPVGFTGDSCEIPTPPTPDPCNPNPCLSPCQCYPSCKHDQGYVCESVDGLLGKTCNIPKPNLLCEQSQISISISDVLFQEFGGAKVDDAFFYFGPNENFQPPEVCKATVIGSGGTMLHNLKILEPFETCESIKTRNPSGDVIVRNKIWFNINAGMIGGLFDMPIPVLQFECVYATDFTVSTSIRPVVDKIDKSLNGTYMKRFSGNFKLCKEVKTCMETCPPSLTVNPGDTYTVGQFIGIIISPDPALLTPGKRAAVHRLFMSCADGLLSVPVVNVVSNGCPPNVLPTIVKQHSTSTCLYFQIPRVHQCEIVFFHAHLIICDESELEYCSTTGLQSKCPNPNRRRRAVVDIDQEDVVGPIFLHDVPSDQIILNQIPELPFEMESFPDAPVAPADDVNVHGSSFKSRDLLIILGSLSFVVLSLSAFVSIKFYRSYRKNAHV